MDQIYPKSLYQTVHTLIQWALWLKGHTPVCSWLLHYIIMCDCWTVFYSHFDMEAAARSKFITHIANLCFNSSWMQLFLIPTIRRGMSAALRCCQPPGKVPGSEANLSQWWKCLITISPNPQWSQKIFCHKLTLQKQAHDSRQAYQSKWSFYLSTFECSWKINRGKMELLYPVLYTIVSTTHSQLKSHFFHFFHGIL